MGLTKSFRRYAPVFAASFTVFIGCGSAKSVKISSEAFTSTGAALVAAQTTVSHFSFCLAQVKLEGEDGTTVEADDSGEIKFTPGLIDVSDGAAKDWGSIDLPTGYKLSKIKVKVKKDKDLCGVDYSVKFNNETTPQDIEFKWKFDPPVELDADSDVIKVSLQEVIDELRAASAAGTIASMKERIEKTEGKCKK